MEKVKIQKAVAAAALHAKIAFRGFCRMAYGAAVAGLIAMSVYVMANISGENGWVAVCDFVGSVAMLILALFCMYVMGGRKAGGSRG